DLQVMSLVSYLTALPRVVSTPRRCEPSSTLQTPIPKTGFRGREETCQPASCRAEGRRSHRFHCRGRPTEHCACGWLRRQRRMTPRNLADKGANRCDRRHRPKVIVPFPTAMPTRTDMAEQNEIIQLQVAGSNERDVGKGTARLPQQAFASLNMPHGTIIEINGQRRTAAIALPPYPEDAGLNIIRLDGLLRANANVSMGDHVGVRAAEVLPASKVVIA